MTDINCPFWARQYLARWHITGYGLTVSRGRSDSALPYPPAVRASFTQPQQVAPSGQAHTSPVRTPRRDLLILADQAPSRQT